VAAKPPPQPADPPTGALGLARKVVVGGVGGAVTAAGIVMLVTPGPGIVVSLAGLGILAKEFPVAASQLDRIRRLTARGRSRDG